MLASLLLEEVATKACDLMRERLEVERERYRVEGMVDEEWRFFFQLLKMGRRANRAEALQEEAKKAFLELRLVLDATRAELDEALAKLSSEFAAMRAERDEVISRVMTAREEVLWFSTELFALRSEVEILLVRDADPGTDKESSRAKHEAARGEVLALQERVVILSSKESELLVESEIVQAEVARLRSELKTSRAKGLQAVSPLGGNALSLGSISANTQTSGSPMSVGISAGVA
ncbi:hypothetical protein ACLOJK_037449 [Asimina triloba]